MYAALRRLLPPTAANLVAAAWYALLILLIYSLWSAPQAAFRYIQI